MFLIFSSSFAAGVSMNSNKYTLERFVSESIKLYPALKIATLNVSRLRYDLDKAESQLGWVLSSEGGYSRTPSSFGIQSDVTDIGLGLEKILESGNSVEIKGRYERSNSDSVIFGLLPNPSNTANIEFNYRIPLLEGEGNLEYSFSIQKAILERKIAILDKQKIQEELMTNLVDIFYKLATLEARYKTAVKSIDRAKKLRQYININIDLGLLERGEIYQVDSQIYTLKLELEKLLDLKQQQIVAINKFLKRPHNSKFIIVNKKDSSVNFKIDLDAILANVINHNYSLEQSRLQREILDASLALRRNQEKSKLDVVMGIGMQNRSGNSSLGPVDDTDATGLIRLEYRNALDKRTFSSQRLQIQIDREKNKEEYLSLSDDIEYDTYSLVNKIGKSRSIVNLSMKRNKNEEKKYSDIINRFKRGRTTTTTVIQFDNERIRAELDYDTERYELEKRIANLEIKQGLFMTNAIKQINRNN